MYRGNVTVVRSTVGIKVSLHAKVGLHQGSALGPFLFTILMKNKNSH